MSLRKYTVWAVLLHRVAAAEVEAAGWGVGMDTPSRVVDLKVSCAGAGDGQWQAGASSVLQGMNGWAGTLWGMGRAWCLRPSAGLS